METGRRDRRRETGALGVEILQKVETVFLVKRDSVIVFGK